MNSRCRIIDYVLFKSGTLDHEMTGLNLGMTETGYQPLMIYLVTDILT